MKRNILKIALTLLFAIPAVGLSAQNYGAQWGSTPEEQVKNVTLYNIFKDAVDNKEFDDALKMYPELVEKVPQGHVNIYIYAADLYKNKINRSKSVAEKGVYVDSLMMVYDQRAMAFGDDPDRGRSYILRTKAFDMGFYLPKERAKIMEYYREALESYGDNAPTEFLVDYFSEVTNDYEADLIEVDEYMAEYDAMEKLFTLPQNAAETKDRGIVEAMFINSGVANCDNLEKIYRPRIAATPDDVALLQKAGALLERGNCDSDFYGEVALQLYALEPSSNAARIIAKFYENRGDNTKALEYLRAAFTHETDPQMKENLALAIAGNELRTNNYRGAAEMAREALGVNPESGYGYFILAQAYSNGSGQCSDLARQSVYWLAYDTMSKARGYFAGDDNMLSTIDRALGSFRSNFPSSEDLFFHGMKDGASYTVRCGWITGATTVRSR